MTTPRSVHSLSEFPVYCALERQHVWRYTGEEERIPRQKEGEFYTLRHQVCGRCGATRKEYGFDNRAV
jgi:hypothetical protein